MTVPAGLPVLDAQQILDVLRAAHRAPSVLNMQPWLLRRLPAGLEVLEDVTRTLPASDPRGRDRVISCGAAVRNAQVALARLGWSPETDVFPNGADDVLIARITAGPASRVSGEVEELYRAIWERRTHRRIFMGATDRDDVPPAVHRAVEGTGARLAVLSPNRRGRFAQLLWQAAQAQVEDEGMRAEMGSWTRRDAAVDGVPARSHGNAPYPVDGLIARSLPSSPSAPAWVVEALAGGPVVAVMTDEDSRADWVRAGVALESVLLAATAEGLVASFLNQVVQQESFRPRLGDLLTDHGFPQAVLRVGLPLVGVPETPRRLLTEVTVE